MTTATPASLRAFYADLAAAAGGLSAGPLRDSFAHVDRAVFLGSGPWRVLTPAGYIVTPGDDPAFIYRDVAIALAPDRGINNGEPHLHARCLAAVDLRPGGRVLQVGAGTGYYTAILAEMIGPSGRIDAFEVDVELAARARINLAAYSSIEVHGRSALEGPLPQADVIYVSAGVTRPPECWLDALVIGGRLLFPLTGPQGAGLMMLVTRGPGPVFGARPVAGVAFIGCAGGRADHEAAALAAALATGGHVRVRSLRRGPHPDADAWLHGAGWWFSPRPPEEA
jgi:protein-L-isoaspartate(D-aspartate) O-methyltransferase